jgi:hypothetical protein
VTPPAQVINIRNTPPGWRDDPNYVYIGRKGGKSDGYFGNPIRRGVVCPRCREVHAKPGDTLPCYKEYMNERLISDQQFRERVKRLHGRILVCFCRPPGGFKDRLLCHGQLLARAAERLNS